MKSIRCPKCNSVKTPEEFYSNQARKNGRSVWCIVCRIEHSHTPAERARRAARYQYARHKDPRVNMLTDARRRAKARGLEFDLVLDDIYIPMLCPVLGIPLKLNNGFLSKENSPSLDRIRTNQGYTKDNIAVISHRANRLKGDATVEELSAILKYAKQETGI